MDTGALLIDEAPFRRKVLEFNLPAGAQHLEHSYPLQTQENSSLSLAQAERFDEMCKDLLWGSEDRQAFGEMLRGLVVAFLPENKFHLHLLQNIASIQWQIHRVSRMQKNLSSSEEAGLRRAKNGLPQSTLNALEYQGTLSKLFGDLRTAIATYWSVRPRPKKA